MVDVMRAIKRPFMDLNKFVIGAVLSIVPVVNLIPMGYELRCAKLAMKGEYNLPEWTEWGDLFVKGLMSFVIGLIYMIPVGVVVLALGIATIGPNIVDTNFRAIIAGAGMTIIAGLALFLVVAYILPSAIMTFVSNDFSFASAFRIKEIVKKTLNSQYLTTWITMAVYSVVLTCILMFIPVIGSAIATFAAGVTMMTAFGELYPNLKA